MGKFKVFAYILLICIIVTLLFAIYFNLNSNKNSEKEIKEKTVIELEYLEGKLVDFLNSLENIETRNYNITVKEIQKNNNEKEQNISNNLDVQSSENEDASDKKNSSSAEKITTEIENNGILIGKKKIDWNNIKKEIELIYISLPTITIDLYQIHNNHDEILEFNKQYDILTTYVKEESKEKVEKQLVDVYSYIPKFIYNTNANIIEKTLLEVKNEIFKSYILLDSENWKEIYTHIQNSVNIYEQLLNNMNNEDKNRKYNINKGYVMIKELERATELKDKEIFLIKYKNLLEEINNI